MNIRIEHARALDYCVPGIRAWCEKHGIDFREFVRKGIDESEIEHIDDAMVTAIIQEAHRGNR